MNHPPPYGSGGKDCRSKNKDAQGTAGSNDGEPEGAIALADGDIRVYQNGAEEDLGGGKKPDYILNGGGQSYKDQDADSVWADAYAPSKSSRRNLLDGSDRYLCDAITDKWKKHDKYQVVVVVQTTSGKPLALDDIIAADKCGNKFDATLQIRKAKNWDRWIGLVLVDHNNAVIGCWGTD